MFQDEAAAFLAALIAAVLIATLVAGELNVGRFGILKIGGRRSSPGLYWVIIALLSLCLVAVGLTARKKQPQRAVRIQPPERPNQSPQHNAGIGPAILDGANPPRPALSSEKTARPQSPRG
jgi:hypothetical protein